MEYWRKKKEKKKEKGEAKECFLWNGSMFLKELIADCNGISNPIRMFSFEQISKATNHFDPKCFLDEDRARYFTLYKGIIQGRSYTIKRQKQREGLASEFNDIVFSARVSNHIGFPKLIGCCLEYPLPFLVFEDLGYRVLNERGTVGGKNAPLLPWNVRLKIAEEVANAITYLHTAFSRIIIHSDIKSENVFLDKNGTAKLTELSAAMKLPEDKPWVFVDERVWGTMGYADPLYTLEGLLTEYSDVYSFGVLMLVLLMGRPPYLQGSDVDVELLDIRYDIVSYVRGLHERGEPVEFGGDSNNMKPDQMKMFLELALRCCKESHEDRPKMIMVAKGLKLIEKGSFDSEILVAKELKLVEKGSFDSEMWENGSEDGSI